ncbi:MAG: 3-isopropylmalate dehydrogenase [Myxococcales bacterium]|nr:3-isopropylmalate dehydrogenase [Myxococcales bacterium]
MAKIAILAGDGIGPEVVTEARAALEVVAERFALGFTFEEALVGGTAYDDGGKPLPDATLRLAQQADAVLLGAVGGPKWEGLDYSVRPERALLALRSELGLFANLRPAKVFTPLVDASPLKRAIIEDVNIMVVRELTGGMYFGEPRGVETLADGRRRGVNTMVYTSDEVERVVRVAFDVAMKRKKKVLSVDKANVLETTEMWREIATEVGKGYPEVALEHMYVDNCAMQLIRRPRDFDVIVTENLFGDILSDEAAMLTGSIGMLPSASLGARGGMYEPVHGSAPDIAGQGKANPLATILSASMMLRYTFDHAEAADAIYFACVQALDEGYRTPDIHTPGTKLVGTKEMGRRVLENLRKQG